MALASAVLATMPAVAQAASPSFSASLVSDEKRRGLSWSDGRAAMRVAADLRLADNFSVDGAFTTLRGSNRHRDASGVFDLRAVYSRSSGAWRTDAELVGHVFTGAEHLNYVELGGGTGVLLGPVQFDAYALYAPKQSAIGGDNLYLGGQAGAAIVGTPLYASAGIGFSTGFTGSSPRLRPGGDYADYRAQLDFTKGPITLGIGYVGTRSARSPDADDRVIARISLGL